MSRPPIRIRHFKPIETAMAAKFVDEGPYRGTWRFNIVLETATTRRMRERDPSLTSQDIYPWALKIDGMVDVGDRLILVEFVIKPRMAVLGQILTYRMHYIDQFRPGKPVDLAVVYLDEAPIVEATLRAQGVALFRMDRAVLEAEGG